MKKTKKIPAQKQAHKAFPRQAIVLAAGLGTRLQPLTHRVPKPALPVGGVPILLFNLYLLKQVGISHITLNLFHRPQVLTRLLKNSAKLGLQLQFSHEHKILGTAGGLAQALHKMKIQEDLFVLNGDILTNLDLLAMHQHHQYHGAQATLACLPPDRVKVKHYVEFDEQHKILSIRGKPTLPKTLKTHQGIFSGVHLLNPSLLTHYPPHQTGCVIQEIYQPALSTGKNLRAYLHAGPWWDLGTINQLTLIDQALWQQKLSPPILQLWQQVYTWAEPLFKAN